MDFFKIKAEIDTKISTRPSNKFGIKVGGELYKELANAGLIEMTEFSAYGTGAFPQMLPAYQGSYYIFHDWELADYDFIVGTPTS